MGKEPSLFIATPWVRPHMGAYTRSLLQAMMPLDVEYKDVFGLAVDIGRNYLINIYKNFSKADFILYIDNDCGFTPGAIKRLMEYDLPMVGGCMYTKDVPPRPAIGKYTGIGSDGKTYYAWGYAAREILAHARAHDIESVEHNEYEFPKSDNDLRETSGMGFHFTLVRRDVIDALNPPYFVMKGKTGAGEDFYFSKKVTDAGFPIYYDVGLHTAHYAGEEYSFGLRELLLVTQYIPVDELIDDAPNLVMG